MTKDVILFLVLGTIFMLPFLASFYHFLKARLELTTLRCISATQEKPNGKWKIETVHGVIIEAYPSRIVQVTYLPDNKLKIKIRL